MNTASLSRLQEKKWIKEEPGLTLLKTPEPLKKWQWLARFSKIVLSEIEEAHSSDD